MPADRCHGGSEIVRLVQRADFGLVGEENVDMTVDEAAKRGAMPPDAERVGKAQRHLASRRMGGRRGFAKGLLRERRVEQIAFEVCDLRRGDHVGVDVGGPELDAGAEIGVHRALPVGRHEDQTARRARTGGGGRRVEAHPGRGNVMAIHLSEEVVSHLADIGAGATERGDPGHRVAG